MKLRRLFKKWFASRRMLHGQIRQLKARVYELQTLNEVLLREEPWTASPTGTVRQLREFVDYDRVYVARRCSFCHNGRMARGLLCEFCCGTGIDFVKVKEGLPV